MSIIANIFYGLISGIAEFFPISSRAHQSIVLYLSGKTARDPLQDLLVHISILLALLVFCRGTLSRLRKERSRRSRQGKGRPYSQKAAYESRLIRTAAVPLIIGTLACAATMRLDTNLLSLACLLTVNGFVLLLAEHARHGNKDASTMSGLDSIMMGVFGTLACFPGLSRTGMITAYSVIRGADRNHSSNWAVVLGIPAMAVAVVMDAVFLVSSGLGTVSFLLLAQYILSAAAAFVGAYIGITFLRIILNRSGFSGFAYYSIGAAVFSFVLYLITW